MPKPLFTRLAAICAVGLFCVLFGCVYALSQKDTILLVMSLLLGVCCIIRFLLLYHTIKTENYLILEGTCVKREKSPLTPKPAGAVPYYGRKRIPLQPGKKYPASGWSQLSALF